MFCGLGWRDWAYVQAYGYIKEAYENAKTGDLADVITLPFYAQLYRGLVRNVGGLCGLGAERRELPNKVTVGRIFADYAGRDLVPTSEVQRHFEHDEETPWELAESIIEKYGAFQADPALQSLLDRQDHAQQRGEPPPLLHDHSGSHSITFTFCSISSVAKVDSFPIPQLAFS